MVAIGTETAWEEEDEASDSDGGDTFSASSPDVYWSAMVEYELPSEVARNLKVSPISPKAKQADFQVKPSRGQPQRSITGRVL